MISLMENVIVQFWNVFFDGKKIPCTSPILHEDKFVTDFQVKSEVYNSYFAKQCSPFCHILISV